ncbi:LysR family transcriptional regulator [Roseovarius sp. 2305UL8-3]|uniref:LysR family transcriptional regulator n=1 Tax=Roseovarius conchicola TaxID=3121636 RepID=UPI0035274DDB
MTAAEPERKISLFDFEILISVAESGSFHQAAKRLGIGQPAVSRRVEKLEDVLGVSLFERGAAGAKLTLAGSEFLTCSSAVYENLKAAFQRARSHAVAKYGELRIGSMSSFSNGPQRTLIKAFIERHPRVRLNFLESERRHMITMLAHRTIDVVIAVGETPYENCDGLLLTQESVFVAVDRDSHFAHSERLTWSDIADEHFLVSSREAGPDIHDFIVRHATAFGRDASIARHHLCRDGVINLVGLGLGVTIVGGHSAGAQYPNVVFVPLGGEDERVPFSLIWRPENDNPALRRFISLARIEARQNGALS